MICAECGQIFSKKPKKKERKRGNKTEKHSHHETKKMTIMDRITDLVNVIEDKEFWKKKTFEKFWFNSKKHRLSQSKFPDSPISNGKI